MTQFFIAYGVVCLEASEFFSTLNTLHTCVRCKVKKFKYPLLPRYPRNCLNSPETDKTSGTLHDSKGWGAFIG